MTIDGQHVTDADRIRLISQMEDDARAQETVEVVDHALTRTPIASAAEAGHIEQLAGDEKPQVKRIHYGSAKPRNGHFL